MDVFAGYSSLSQLWMVTSVCGRTWSTSGFSGSSRATSAATPVGSRPSYVDPFLSVTFEEYEGGRIKSSDAYKEVSGTRGVRHLRAETGGERDNAADRDKLVLSMVHGEEVADDFHGATVWWSAYSVAPPRDAIPWYPSSRSDRRSYKLEFHESDRDLVLGSYLQHVRRQGRAVMVQNRQRRLYTNISRSGYDDGYTFDKLAMDPAKKKDYYNRIGKPWKRGYLLYGPPGTGKSTMVAAMANYLDYDVYDLELTSVKTNTDLRKLLIETKSKSIMVFEDIDCSLDLTGKRKTKEEEEDDEEEPRRRPNKQDTKKSKVTLSGLLNFIDGLWSACGEERLVVFTTNHVGKLDPALIRTGRMDKKIDMSYCDLDSLSFLAKLHLEEDVQGHQLFGVAKALLQEVDMVPVDVGEHLTRKTVHDDAGSCLARLVTALEKAKEEAAAKTTEAAKAEDDAPSARPLEDVSAGGAWPPSARPLEDVSAGGAPHPWSAAALFDYGRRHGVLQRLGCGGDPVSGSTAACPHHQATVLLHLFVPSSCVPTSSGHCPPPPLRPVLLALLGESRILTAAISLPNLSDLTSICVAASVSLPVRSLP
ncbi:hypothetical protein HU200_059737 [Digitaria exilis]|uniref:AAA+ ATPase domain-containing protein n=1 Tax=Digitaria exilis TaxID=1010633 RepID=A0A835ABG2_9POAL|nr:hypothetical protein HU200_059737 [Digitaria exilis]